MSDYTFARGPIPGVRSVGRKAEPNPFLKPVESLINDDGSLSDESLTFTVADHTWETPEVQKLTRQLARAGKAHNVSVYKRLDATEDGAGTVITFWVQTRIVPQRVAVSD